MSNAVDGDFSETPSLEAQDDMEVLDSAISGVSEEPELTPDQAAVAALEFDDADTLNDILAELGAEFVNDTIVDDWPLTVWAVHFGAVECLELLLAAGANVDAVAEDEDGTTPLIMAVKSLQFEMAELLLERLCNPSMTDSMNNTPLHHAVRLDAIDFVNVLLFRQANILAAGENGWSPLHLATGNDVAGVLVQQGADVNQYDDYGFTSLHMAVYNNQPDLVQLYLEFGADPNIGNVSGLTPLMIGCRNGHTDCVWQLLEVEAIDPAIKDVTGNTALHRACRCPDGGQSLRAVEWLVARKEVDVQQSNHLGETPLHLARSKSVVEFLMSSGANLRRTDHRANSPLHSALLRHDVDADVAITLIVHGANITQPNRDGDTPLMLAAARGATNVVESILSTNIDITKTNKRGETALHRACIAAAGEVLIQLLRAGAGMNLAGSTKDGRSPLHMTASAFCAHLLIAGGADVNFRDSEGRTPLHAAVSRTGGAEDTEGIDTSNVERGPGDNVELVAALLEHNADINSKQDLDGCTPLILAAEAGNARCMDTLIRRGAHIDIVSNDGQSALHYAVQNGVNSADCTQLLVDGEANTNATTPMEGWTPLHLVIDAQTAKILLEDGNANVDVVDARGTTPLHTAAYRGLHELVVCFLKHGADSNAVNGEGLTPLMMGALQGSSDIVQSLLSHGADPSIVDEQDKTAMDHTLPFALQQASKDHAACVKLIQRAIDGDIDEEEEEGEEGEEDNIRKSQILQASINKRVYSEGGKAASGFYMTTFLSRVIVPRAVRIERNDEGPPGEVLEPILALLENDQGARLATLLESGIDAELCPDPNAEFDTLLHIACDIGAPQCIAALLVTGASPVSLDGGGATPMMRCVVSDQPVDILDMFMQAVAPTEEDPQQCTRLIDAWDAMGLTTIAHAALKGNLEWVDGLIKAGVDPNLVGTIGEPGSIQNSGIYPDMVVTTPLALAVYNGHQDIVKELLAGGAEPHFGEVSIGAIGAVHQAARQGNEEILKMLLDKCESQNRKRCAAAEIMVTEDKSVTDVKRTTPLHVAMTAATTRLLVEHGYDPFTVDLNGNTALHTAIAGYHVDGDQAEVVDTLIALVDERDDPQHTLSEYALIRNDAGYTPVTLAAQRGYTESLKLIMSTTASLDMVDGNGYSPLHAAVQTSSLECASCLLDNGNTFVDIRTTDTGYTPLHLCQWSAVAEVLIGYGADVNANDFQGFRPLHYAAQGGLCELVEVLADAKAEIDARTESLETPLMLAAQTGDPECCEVLLARGASIPATNAEGLLAIEQTQSGAVSTVIQEHENWLAIQDPDTGLEVAKSNRSVTPVLEREHFLRRRPPIMRIPKQAEDNEDDEIVTVVKPPTRFAQNDAAIDEAVAARVAAIGHVSVDDDDVEDKGFDERGRGIDVFAGLQMDVRRDEDKDRDGLVEIDERMDMLEEEREHIEREAKLAAKRIEDALEHQDSNPPISTNNAVDKSQNRSVVQSVGSAHSSGGSFYIDVKNGAEVVVEEDKMQEEEEKRREEEEKRREEEEKRREEEEKRRGEEEEKRREEEKKRRGEEEEERRRKEEEKRRGEEEERRRKHEEEERMKRIEEEERLRIMKKMEEERVREEERRMQRRREEEFKLEIEKMRLEGMRRELSRPSSIETQGGWMAIQKQTFEEEKRLLEERRRLEDERRKLEEEKQRWIVEETKLKMQDQIRAAKAETLEKTRREAEALKREAMERKAREEAESRAQKEAEERAKLEEEMRLVRLSLSRAKAVAESSTPVTPIAMTSTWQQDSLLLSTIQANSVHDSTVHNDEERRRKEEDRKRIEERRRREEERRREEHIENEKRRIEEEAEEKRTRIEMERQRHEESMRIWQQEQLKKTAESERRKQALIEQAALRERRREERREERSKEEARKRREESHIRQWQEKEAIRIAEKEKKRLEDERRIVRSKKKLAQKHKMNIELREKEEDEKKAALIRWTVAEREDQYLRSYQRRTSHGVKLAKGVAGRNLMFSLGGQTHSMLREMVRKEKRT